MNNIIFIIFVFLFIIFLIGINQQIINQESFYVKQRLPPKPLKRIKPKPKPIKLPIKKPQPKSTPTPTPISTPTPTSISTPTPTSTSIPTTTTNPIETTSPPIITKTVPITTVPMTTTPSPFAFNTNLWFDINSTNLWNTYFTPSQVQFSPYSVNLYTIDPDNPDPDGFSPPSENSGISFDNYLKVAFDNRAFNSQNGYYANFIQNPNISVQTIVKDLPIGNYLMTYYISSSEYDTDTQSISVTSGVDNTIGTPFVLQSFIKNGIWVKQQFAFSITTNTSPHIFQFIFELFDTKLPSFSIVAVGGVIIEYCGNKQCNIDCTTYYSDWSTCDVSYNLCKRMAELSVRNSNNTCPKPSITKSCLDAINFLGGLSSWNIVSTPVGAISNKSIQIFATIPQNDTNYRFNTTNIPFSTPYVIVNFDNGKYNDNFKGYKNPTVAMSTSLKLQNGIYRIRYYIQSWSRDPLQLIQISTLFGNVNNTFVPKGNIDTGTWYLLTTEVEIKTSSVVPIQFMFTLNNPSYLSGSTAFAFGGINITYCGNQPCEIKPSPTPFPTTPAPTTPSPTTPAPTTPSPTTPSPTTPAPTTPAPTTPAPTLPIEERCYTDWSTCDYNYKITDDMLTDNIRKSIEYTQTSINTFLNAYNNFLTTNKLKIRKLKSNADSECIDKTRLVNLISMDCKN